MTPILWHKLPGPVYVKAIIALIAVIGVFLLLMEVVYPAISPYMPFNDMSVSDPFIADTADPAPAPAEAPVEEIPQVDVDPDRLGQSPAMG